MGDDTNPKVDALVERYGDSWLIWCDQPGIWWRPDGHGYTSNVLDAGIYTRDHVLRQHKSRNYDRPVSLLSLMAAANGPRSVASLLVVDLPKRDLLELAAQRVAITKEEWDAARYVPR